MLDDLKSEAQQVLDELSSNGVLPFGLTAYKVESLGFQIHG